MVCVLLSFTLDDERSVKEFGFELPVAVLLDAFVVRCGLLLAVLHLLGAVDPDASPVAGAPDADL